MNRFSSKLLRFWIGNPIDIHIRCGGCIIDTYCKPRGGCICYFKMRNAIGTRIIYASTFSKCQVNGRNTDEGVRKSNAIIIPSGGSRAYVKTTCLCLIAFQCYPIWSPWSAEVILEELYLVL